jgi:hypothetical protein
VSKLNPGGRCCWSFPMRTLGLRPCISMRRRSKSKCMRNPVDSHSTIMSLFNSS